MAIQANAFIQSAMFQEYKYNDDTPCVFRINLNALIVSNIKKNNIKMYSLNQECLNIFGSGSGSGYESHTALKLYYNGYGNPLQLL